MKAFFTIFSKELKDTLRDRRTLLAMIVVPFCLIPLILSITTRITTSQSDKAMEKQLRVAVVDNDNGNTLLRRMRLRNDLTLYDNIDPSDFNALIRKDSIDMGMVIADDFDSQIANGTTGAIDIFYDATADSMIYTRLERSIRSYKNTILQTRLDSLGATMATITPIRIQDNNVYSQREFMGKMVGGVLPYFFVIFCLVGAMYPAIDLFTGEKERGTLETILTAPVSRLAILTGKMAVVILSGVISGILTILGLFVALKINPDMPEFISNIVMQILDFKSILLVFLMMVPMTAFFAGMLIPASIYARNYKEAMSIIQPLMYIVIFPLIIAMSPAIKLNVVTALIPVINIALATREIVAGTIDVSLMVLVYVSLFAFAAAGILLCVNRFGKESNILRT